MGPLQSETDERLATRARGGERDAFEVLVQRYAATLLAVLEKQVDDHHLAHDLAQDVWIKAFRALRRWEPLGSFRSWLFSIALNHVRDSRRSKSRKNVVYLDQFRSHPPAPHASDPKGRAEEHAAIQESLQHVNEPFRTALVLVDVVGLSYEEAAGNLSVAVGTVKSRVNRGRLAFRDAYGRLTDSRDDEVRRDRSGATP